MEVFEGKAWISGQGLIDTCIGVEEGKITAVKKILKGDKQTVVDGIILPSALDMHVHFRDPGYPNKEDWKSGSESAACGGVTAVVDMPNTNPPTSNMTEFQRKLDLAKNRMYCNYAFYFGATADNARDLASLKDLEGCCGIKLFAGSSTGNLLVAEEDDIEKVFQNLSIIHI